MRILMLVLVVLSAVVPLAAEDLESTAKEIEGKIMAPCCAANPVSQHYSPAADQARRQIRSMLQAGKSEEQILDWFVEQHGETILASPRAEGFGLVAWLGPVVLFCIAGIWLWYAVKGWNRRTVADPPEELPEIDPAYAERLRKELADSPR
ncbi:MAG: cytochrome c-type biogenesis protein CcmH [bacterium]|nr:cytochrome c-type biogenesis protein CcmH [bacterium]